MFLATLVVLCVLALALWKLTRDSSSPIENKDFIKLQRRYMIVYCTSAFSDWLQGPYLYKVYSDHGYDCGAIAILYVVGVLSSALLGVPIGLVADSYSRRLVCASYGVLYTVCCVATISSSYPVLVVGRIFGGVSTAILFTTFESWYVNEHLNRYRFPPDWLHATLGKSGFCNGFLAIIAGIFSHVLVDRLNLGLKSPFVMAVPFLSLSTHLVICTWDESPFKPDQGKPKFCETLYLICYKEPLLLLLCFIQSLYESVIYVFVFSWSPIVSVLDPPLGIIFSTFMISFMIGSNLYRFLASGRLKIPHLLTGTCMIGLLSFAVATLFLLMSLVDYSFIDRTKSTYALFYCFLFYELSIGLYYPTVGYLRSRIVPEKYRTSVTNWFRVPMNTFTCLILMFQHLYCEKTSHTSPLNADDGFKFAVIFSACTLMLLGATGMSYAFGTAYFTKVPETSDLVEYKTESQECLTKKLSVERSR